MDRDKVRQIRESVEAALRAVAAEHNVHLDVGGGSYTPANVIYKITFAEQDADGIPRTKNAEDFRRFATLYGLAADDLGKRFESAGNTFEITGLSRRSRKYPVTALKLGTTQVYKFPADVVRFYLAATK